MDYFLSMTKRAESVQAGLKTSLAYRNDLYHGIWLAEDVKQILVVWCPECEEIVRDNEYVSHWIRYHNEHNQEE